MTQRFATSRTRPRASARFGTPPGVQPGRPRSSTDNGPVADSLPSSPPCTSRPEIAERLQQLRQGVPQRAAAAVLHRPQAAQQHGPEPVPELLLRQPRGGEAAVLSRRTHAGAGRLSGERGGRTPGRLGKGPEHATRKAEAPAPRRPSRRQTPARRHARRRPRPLCRHPTAAPEVGSSLATVLYLTGGPRTVRGANAGLCSEPWLLPGAPTAEQGPEEHGADRHLQTGAARGWSSGRCRGQATTDPVPPAHAGRGAGNAPGRFSWGLCTINVACTWGCTKPLIPTGQQIHGTEGNGKCQGFPTLAGGPRRE